MSSSSSYEGQPLLFDIRRFRRNTDPSTSEEGAIRAVERIRHTSKFALDCITQTPGLTQNELARHYGTKDSRTIGRMCKLLAEAGLVHTGPRRKDKYTNVTANTWWPGHDPNVGN